MSSNHCNGSNAGNASNGSNDGNGSNVCNVSNLPVTSTCTIGERKIANTLPLVGFETEVLRLQCQVLNHY